LPGGEAAPGTCGSAELAPPAAGAAGKLEAVGSVEGDEPELLQPRPSVIQTVELMNSSRRRVGMGAQLSHPALARAMVAPFARTKAERSFARRSPKRDKPRRNES
jgi:hypothetical protein